VLRLIAFCGVLAVWRPPCGGTRALPYPARLCDVCALAAIRRAVGGSPRVLGVIAFCGVFSVWRRPCRGTRALPYPARLWGRVCVGGNQASRGREPTGVAFDCVFSVWRRPCRGTRALPYPARLRGRVCGVGNHSWPVAVCEMWQIGEQIPGGANFAGHSRLSVGAGGREMRGQAVIGGTFLGGKSDNPDDCWNGLRRVFRASHVPR
jgi:hypothetical protein